MQNEQHIKRLIDLFLEGNSTLEQEQELAQFFSSHEVKEEWKPVQQMFAYFDNGMEEMPAQILSRKKSRHRWVYWAASAVTAAAVAAADFLALRPASQSESTTLPAQPPVAEVKPQQLPVKPADSSAAVDRHQPALVASAANPKKHEAVQQKTSRKNDSLEIVRTQAELEMAEQELAADRIILQQELQQTQQPRHANQNSGWVTTSLNIQ